VWRVAALAAGTPAGARQRRNLPKFYLPPPAVPREGERVKKAAFYAAFLYPGGGPAWHCCVMQDTARAKNFSRGAISYCNGGALL
jgi:hypothetical protein